MVWVTLAAVAALTIVAAFLNLGHLALLETTLTIGFCLAYLYQSALGGWLSSIVSGEEEKSISMWMSIGAVGGFGVMAIGCDQLVRHLSPTAVALALGAAILMPMIPFPLMQAPGPDRLLASESFPRFFSDVVFIGEAARGTGRHLPFCCTGGDVFTYEFPRQPRQ